MDKQKIVPKGIVLRRTPKSFGGAVPWECENIAMTGVTDKVIVNVAESVSAVGSDVAKMTPGEIASETNTPVHPQISEDSGVTYNFSDDDDGDSSKIAKSAAVRSADASDLSEREKFRQKQQSHIDRAKKMNLMIAICALSLFMVVVIFITAILQIENTFILTANENYEIPETEFITANRAYDVYKEERLVNVSFEGGKAVSMTMPPITVHELVEYLYPDLDDSGKHYEFSHEPDTIIDDGMTIEINAVEYVMKTVVEPYRFGVINNEVQTIPKGTREVIQVGVNGSVERDLKEKYVNGVLSDTIIEATRVLSEPINEIANVGVGGTFVNLKGKTIEYSYYVDVLASAYGVDTGYGGDLAYTYTGTLARFGVIAVDPDVIPFGSDVYLVGEEGNMEGTYGDMGRVFHAEDAGNAIIGNRIDIYMGDDLERQMKFGKRNMRVYVLSSPEVE